MALGMAGTTCTWKISGPGYVPATWYFLSTQASSSPLITPLTKMQPKAPDRGGMPVPRRQSELGLKGDRSAVLDAPLSVSLSF